MATLRNEVLPCRYEVTVRRFEVTVGCFDDYIHLHHRECGREIHHINP
jgi:hypothetical protein